MSEVFRTGRSVPSIVLAAYVFFFASVSIGLAWASANNIRTNVFGSCVFAALSLLFGFLAVYLVLYWLNSFVSLSREGVLWQGWYRQQGFIRWTGVKRVVITDWPRITTLAIDYLDPEGHIRRRKLAAGGFLVAPPQEAIMRYKAFPNRRRRFAGLQEVYEACDLAEEARETNKASGV